MHQKIYYFEIDPFPSLNLLKLLWLKLLIYGNGYRTFYNNMENIGNLRIVYVYKNEDGFFSDLVIYTICSIDRTFYTCLHYVDLYKDSYSRVVVFLVIDIISLNNIFSIFPLAGIINLLVHLKTCHWIWIKLWFYLRGILFLALFSRYAYFGIRCVSISMKLHLFHWES